ncbi:hypothetical protein HMPREF3158_01555 [Corynebacterium sp. HMSC06G04]|nr:hypothetical protein HMPREF3158_01555 [Corynebacterium sp. HMSC06G04]
MAKKASVAKNEENFFLFSLSQWEIYEIPHEVYLEVKAMESPLTREQNISQWVSPEVREEIERWIQ